VTTYAEAIALAEGLLHAAGMPEPDATVAARALATADAWGIGSHGLLRLPYYLERFASGAQDPAAQLTLVSDSGPTAAYNGNGGLGHPQLWRAAELAAERCGEHGIAAISVGNSSHCGCLGVYAFPVLAEGQLALVFSNGPAVMPPWGGNEPLLSTSPIAAGIPCRPRPAIVDLATSAVARGKIAAYAARDEPLPPGWAVDAGGTPTTDPAAALAGMLAPLGGVKGYALALLVEALSGGIVGPALAGDVPDMFNENHVRDPQRIAHLVVAFDPARLDVDGSAQHRLDALAQRVTAAGGRLPGQHRDPPDQIASGIELDLSPALLDRLAAWRVRLDIQE
jgi:(2R)-3-sulfolactate dehydrogenase (NADP+)